MVSYFVFKQKFCNPAAGSEKGQGENQVRDGPRRLSQVVLASPGLGAGKLLWPPEDGGLR
jgi:hypothetical protein